MHGALIAMTEGESNAAIIGFFIGMIATVIVTWLVIKDLL